MVDLDFIPTTWANRLGLALSHLFGEIDRTFVQGAHYALLDGVEASFGLSASGQADEGPRPEAVDWAWSANLRKHLWIENGQTVHVISAAKRNVVDRYSLSTVTERLEEFLDFLAADRQLPSQGVVDHVVSQLLHFRAKAVHGVGPDVADKTAMRALLFDLAQRMDPSCGPESLAQRYGLDAQSYEAFSELRPSPVFVERDDYNFHPGIAIRHAGGAIFQQATAQLVLQPQIDLFTGAQVATTGLPDSLKLGGYFTPPGLARSVAELALSKLVNKTSISICDPACGSGVFLAEALRALKRFNYQGTVRITGYDISSVAVEIARFSAHCAALDFGADRVEITVSERDTLIEGLPQNQFDVILMNPPFLPWEQLNTVHRSHLRTVMAEHYKGRPDLSLAFAHIAFDALIQGGVLASLMPVGLLSGEYSLPWRHQLAERGTIRFIGALGNHYLFQFALVNIGALVVDKAPPIGLPTRMLWASEEQRASSNALRKLRKEINEENTGSIQRFRDGWKIYSLPQRELLLRTNWAPSPSTADDRIALLRGYGAKKIEELFTVRQGIRTGSRAAFILSKIDLDSLPTDERKAFRSIAEKDSIRDFQITPSAWIFYPKEEPSSEEEFRETYPIYYERFILPNEEALRRRPRGVKIWQLSWSRAWLRKHEPRIVSRMFIGPNQKGFAVDETGKHAVVQGYGWVPVWTGLEVGRKAEDRLVALQIYAFLFASSQFFEMVQSVSINIAGGQFDLSPKYINALPLPTWPMITAKIASPITPEYVRELFGIFQSSPHELNKFASIFLGASYAG